MDLSPATARHEAAQAGPGRAASMVRRRRIARTVWNAIGGGRTAAFPDTHDTMLGGRSSDLAVANGEAPIVVDPAIRARAGRSR